MSSLADLAKAVGARLARVLKGGVERPSGVAGSMSETVGKDVVRSAVEQDANAAAGLHLPDDPAPAPAPVHVAPAPVHAATADPPVAVDLGKPDVARAADATTAELPPIPHAATGASESAAPVRLDLQDPRYTALLGDGDVYRKKGSTVVRARQAQGGERVRTVLADGHVEVGKPVVARPGQMILTGAKGEQWVFNASRPVEEGLAAFAAEYEPTGTPGAYRSTGEAKVRAIRNPTGGDIVIAPPWDPNGEQFGKADCWIVAKLVRGQMGPDRYIVGSEEFGTYEPDIDEPAAGAGPPVDLP
ncbi:hypothetical protein [Nocardia sp. NBC_01388]|uniref:hypothetical protein n=1 Tax=Nocardia sp. NBC_01388 TaxID=2903596 RepID=UPI00324D2BF0